MTELFPQYTLGEYVTYFITVTSCLAGILSALYTYLSYLKTNKLKKESDVLNREMQEYYHSFINIPPNKKTNDFLKKGMQISINQGVDLPIDIVDCLIKNYSCNYFDMVSKLKNTHKFFVVKGSQLSCKYNNTELTKMGLLGGLMYLFFGCAAVFVLQHASWFYGAFGGKDGLSSLNISTSLMLLVVCFLVAAIISLTYLMRLFTIKEISAHINRLNNEKGPKPQ